MVICDFGRLEILLVKHFLTRKSDVSDDEDKMWNNTYGKKLEDISEVFGTSYKGVAWSSDYFDLALQIDNTQLHCDFALVDSTDNESDVFQLDIWNLPSDTVVSTGDVFVFKYYWDAAPEDFTVYHGVVETVTNSFSNADQKTTVKGSLIHQSILYNTSIELRHALIEEYTQVKDIVTTDLGLNFVSNIPAFETEGLKLNNTIYAADKTVGVIFEEICRDLNEMESTVEYKWKIVNNTDVIFYAADEKGSPLGELANFKMLVIDINDILEITDSDESSIKFKVFGIPTVRAGTVVKIEVPEGTAEFIQRETNYYAIDEIKQNITVSDGFISEVFAHEVVQDEQE